MDCLHHIIREKIRRDASSLHGRSSNGSKQVAWETVAEQLSQLSLSHRHLLQVDSEILGGHGECSLDLIE